MMRPDLISKFGVILILALLTFLAFFPSLTGGWLGDDIALVVNSRCGKDFSNLPDVLKLNAGVCNYRPLRYLSYAVDHSIWGLNPFGYRLSNLLFHVSTTLVVLWFFRLAGLSWAFAVAGALLFGIHPVQADSAAYVSGRRDVLMGLFYMLSITCFAYSNRAGPKHRRKAVIYGALALFAAGMSIASKEMGVTILAMVVLWILLGGTRVIRDNKLTAHNKALLRTVFQVSWWLVPLTLITGFVVVHRGLVDPVSTIHNKLFGGTLHAHFATVMSVHARYIELLLFPMRLLGDYSPDAIAIQDTIFNFPSLIGILWLSGLAALAIWAWKATYRREAYGLLWYLITMLPVSHIVPHHEIAAEHYLYIPIVGLLLALLSLIQRRLAALEGHRLEATQRVLLATLLLIVCALFARTIVRSMDYRSEMHHSAATVRWEPHSVRGHARHGISLLNEELFDKARPHLEFVLSTAFRGSARMDVLKALGNYYLYHHQYPLAVKSLSEYVASYPKKPELTALGKAYFHLKDYKKAHQIYLRLVYMEPENSTFRYLAALTFFHLDDHHHANVQLDHALRYDPDNLNALLLRVKLLLLAGESTQAQEHLTHAQNVFDQLPEPIGRAMQEYEAQYGLLVGLRNELQEDR